ncbi:hypothetical protein RRG08_064519 [Elysia crispata]|uniref:Uncharacterized protein n=1 Tax=Elysia crispata TaxID=231223 RepID=A0AAE1CUH2_9GAST|nr:hypothetical protein RRG08_064519 [Elysia crispata]
MGSLYLQASSAAGENSDPQLLIAGLCPLGREYRSFTQLGFAATLVKDAGQRVFCLAPVLKTQLISHFKRCSCATKVYSALSDMVVRLLFDWLRTKCGSSEKYDSINLDIDQKKPRRLQLVLLLEFNVRLTFARSCPGSPVTQPAFTHERQITVARPCL